MKNRILCSTGALIGRPNGRDYTLLDRCAEQIDCDGFEFMMYDTWYGEIDRLKRFMENFPKPIPVFHVEKQIGERISRNEEGDTETALSLFEINCGLAQTLGAERLVLHLWNGIHSDKNIAHNIALYPLLREIAARYHLQLTIENVVCNHADPLLHWKALADRYPEIEFTFDTKMAAFHGQSDELYKAENKWLTVHIRHMHINDYGGGYMEWSKLKTLHIGDGHIDFDRFFRWVREIGYDGDFTVEATSFDQSGKIDFEKMNKTIRHLRAYL